MTSATVIPSLRRSSLRAMAAVAFAGLVCTAGSRFAEAATVPATFTTVRSAASGESSITQILGKFYAGTFTQVGSTRNYSNGTFTATRVDDGALGTLGLNDTSVDGKSDQIWSAPAGEQVSFTVYSTFSAAAQRFGYMDGASGGSFHQLGTIFGSRFSALGGGTLSDLNLVAGSQFRWARSTNGTTVQTSRNADNNNVDKMVTYRITGDDKPHFVLFFEDGTDGDYNDLAVEVNVGSRVLPPGYSVPVPAMALPAVFSLGGLALAASRRRVAR